MFGCRSQRKASSKGTAVGTPSVNGDASSQHQHVVVAYASQTGTAQEIARNIQAESSKHGIQSKVFSPVACHCHLHLAKLLSAASVKGLQPITACCFAAQYSCGMPTIPPFVIISVWRLSSQRLLCSNMTLMIHQQLLQQF